MLSVTDRIHLDLKKRYNVDEHFYPKISMDLDIPGGFRGEIADTIETLQKNGFHVSSESVFSIIELKKTLLGTYSETAKGKEKVLKYRKLLLEDMKSIGTGLPVEIILANGLVVVMLYLLARFTGSFVDEAGKIMARKLLEGGKERSKKLNLDVREYSFLKEETMILVKDGELLDSLRKRLKRAS